jgi:hypothetical protein
MSKADLPRRPLFKSAPGAFVPIEPANKSKPAANKSRGRPIVSTGDPAKDKRNAQQRDLMRKRRAAK